MNLRQIKRNLSFWHERWQMKSLRGSGIATFQYVTCPTTKNPILCALMFENQKRGFGFTGGFCDRESPCVAASREIFEESSGLLHIESSIVKNIDPTYIFFGFYQSFPILIDSTIQLTTHMFHSNQQKLKEQNASRYYLEMSDIRYIPIQNMMDDGLLEGNGSMLTRDKDGQNIKIINRSRTLLKKIRKKTNWTETLIKGQLHKSEDHFGGFSAITNYNIQMQVD